MDSFKDIRLTIQESMKLSRVLSGFGVTLVLSAGAAGQGFNIDVDVGAGSEAVCNGAPSMVFGAAPDQPGFWKRLDAADHSYANPLFDLGASPSLATVRWNVSGGGSGSGWAGNSGDYRLLLNDRTIISVPINYFFEGFLPGRYAIYTYAVDGGGETTPAEITVPGAEAPIRYSGTTGMRGNTFELGVTHCVHEIVLTGSSFQVTARSLGHHASLNGFQIAYQPVPEPSATVSLILGLGLMVARRRG